MPNLSGHRLINGNSRVQIGPGRFFDSHTGQKCAASPGVIPCPIRAAFRAMISQPGNHLQLILHLAEGLQRRRKLKAGSGRGCRPPGGRNGSVWNIHKGHAHRLYHGHRALGSRGGAKRRERAQRGQRHASTQPTQKMTPIQAKSPLRRHIALGFSCSIHFVHGFDADYRKNFNEPSTDSSVPLRHPLQAFRFLRMFDTISAELITAKDKLAHLRRFL